MNHEILRGPEFSLARSEKALDDILHDRALARKFKDNDSPLPSPGFFLPKFPEEEQEIMEENIDLLHHLSGHRGSMLRKIVLLGRSPEAKHLRDLFEWSQDPDQSADVLIAPVPEKLTAGTTTPEELFERLTFIEKHPDIAAEHISEEIGLQTAKAAGSEKTKWLELIDPVLNSRDPAVTFTKIFKSVGFIPGELGTKKKFKSLSAKILINDLEALRGVESSGSFSEIARYERARLLNASLTGGNFNELRKGGEYMTLDANGIFINLPGFHTHLPWGLLSDPAREALERDNWLSKDQLAEVDFRRSEENSNIQENETAKEKQLLRFCGAEGLDLSERTADDLTDSFLKEPEKFAGQLSEKKLLLPDIIAEKAAARDGAGIAALTRFGEAVTASLTDEDLGKHQKYDPYHFINATEEEYEARSRVLNQPGYYNAHKALRAILAANPKTSKEEEFLILRGNYKRSRQGDQHSFLETFYRGVPSRILLNEEKHLSGTAKNVFEALPLYNKNRYDELERAFRSYSQFHDQVKKLRTLLRGQPQLFAGEGDWSLHFKYAAEAAVHFMLQNSSQKLYRKADELFRSIWENYMRNLRTSKPETENIDGKEALDFLKIAEEATLEYRKFLYRSIGTQADFVESFMPEAEPKEIRFGKKFYDEMKALSRENDGINEKLSMEESTVRVVQMNYKQADPTSTIPFHIEEQVLDMARLDRNRPFINVIGGCRKLKESEDNPFASRSEAVMRVAHACKANVSVPGTQSGIGTYFGEENVRYMRETEHLPMREKAHMFAVSPGGNVPFPGNSFLDKQNIKYNYALTPVDQIITPFDAGWDLPPKEKRNAPYREHVRYMESLFDRMSYGQRRIDLIGNGGLFAIMEISASFKRGFPLFLIEDSGRLGTVLSSLVQEMFYGRINSDTTEDGLYAEVIRVLKDLPQDVAEEFITKDFGREKEPENEGYALYRDEFYQLLHLINSDYRRTRSIKFADLEEHLTTYMLADEKNLARYPGEWL